MPDLMWSCLHWISRFRQATPLLRIENLLLRPGERTLVTGPSGVGQIKHFFRAVAGILALR